MLNPGFCLAMLFVAAYIKPHVFRLFSCNVPDVPIAAAMEVSHPPQL